MRVRFFSRAIEQYESLSPALRKAADKQLMYLRDDIRHPSLHAKKYDEATGLWQARINRSWRFYFFVRNGYCEVVSIKVHPK